MDPEGLLERIKKLDEQIIEKMSPDVMARLTNNFDELLVRNLLYSATTNHQQRKLIKKIRENYRLWKKDTDMMWGSLPQLQTYPEFLEDLKMDIECGMVINEKGTFPEGGARLEISLIPTGAKPLKALHKESQSTLPSDKEKNTEKDQSGLTDLQARIKELQEELDTEKAKNAKLEEEKANKAQLSNDEYEEVKRRNDVLESLNKSNEKRLVRYESILGTEEQLSKEKKFSITERIIFCSALLGCSLSEDDISQMQMAKLITRFSGDKWESIRTTISKMNGKRTALVDIEKKAAKEKDAGARVAVWKIEGEKYKGITNAALNVYNYLHAAVKGETIAAKVYRCRQAMEDIDQAYYLSERKLIDRTDRQPEGDFELPPDEI